MNNKELIKIGTTQIEGFVSSNSDVLSITATSENKDIFDQLFELEKVEMIELCTSEGEVYGKYKDLTPIYIGQNKEKNVVTIEFKIYAVTTLEERVKGLEEVTETLMLEALGI